MTKSIAAAIALSIGVLALSTPAQAVGSFGKLGDFNNASETNLVQKVGGKRHRRHRGAHRYFHFGDRVGYGHGYYRNCSYLKRKAHYTGSRYWWKRYRLCVSRIYY